MNRILIVDDFLEDRFFLSYSIKQSVKDASVEEFAYAEDAIEHITGNTQPEYDLIFADINMLRMDGFEFVEAYMDSLTKGQRPARIFLVSGTFDQRDIDRAEQSLVIESLLKKPVSQMMLDDLLVPKTKNGHKSSA